MERQILATITRVTESAIELRFADGSTATVPMAGVDGFQPDMVVRIIVSTRWDRTNDLNQCLRLGLALGYPESEIRECFLEDPDMTRRTLLHLQDGADAILRERLEKTAAHA